MLSLRILLRAILLAVGIQLSWGAALASAQQHLFSVFNDVFVNESTLFGDVSTFDQSTDECGHFGHTTWAILDGPTGSASGSSEGFVATVSVPLADGDFDITGELQINTCDCDGLPLSAFEVDPVQIRGYASRWAMWNGWDPDEGKHQWMPRPMVQECFHKCAQPNIGLVLSDREPLPGPGQENFSALQRFGTNVEIRGTGACVAFAAQDSVYDYRTHTDACRITP